MDYTTKLVGRKSITVRIFTLSGKHYLEISSRQKEEVTGFGKLAPFTRDNDTSIQSEIDKETFEEYKELGVKDTTRKRPL